MGAFDHLKWTYDEAFEQLFGPGGGGGHLNKNFPKIQGMFKLQFDWYIIFKVRNSDEAFENTNCCKLFQKAQKQNSTETKDDSAATYFNRHIRQTFTERN